MEVRVQIWIWILIHGNYYGSRSGFDKMIWILWIRIRNTLLIKREKYRGIMFSSLNEAAVYTTRIKFAKKPISSHPNEYLLRCSSYLFTVISQPDTGVIRREEFLCGKESRENILEHFPSSHTNTWTVYLYCTAYTTI